jgi:hypothetical protein
MKKIQTYLRLPLILLVMLSGFLVSCHDQLKEEIFSFVGATNYWKTEADADAGILGAYESFLSNDYFGRFYFDPIAYRIVVMDYISLNHCLGSQISI